MLEVEFVGEEGTGLGPSLEFYSLIASEFQRKDMGMWICDDKPTTLSRAIDLGNGGACAEDEAMVLYRASSCGTSALFRHHVPDTVGNGYTQRNRPATTFSGLRACSLHRSRKRWEGLLMWLQSFTILECLWPRVYRWVQTIWHPFYSSSRQHTAIPPFSRCTGLQSITVPCTGQLMSLHFAWCRL